MACAHPLTIPNPLYFSRGSKFYAKKNFSVPCGWCLNCRVDKRNFLEDCAREEYKKYGYGAFVTFTYDDMSLLHNLHSNKDSMIASLSVKDSQDLMKRIRRNIDYYKMNSKQIRKDFKYISVGEYGGEYGRPHLHVLFFGLDFDICKSLFKKCWSYGLVDSRPILKGGIRYVLKYIDKQMSKKSSVSMYSDNGIEPPFSHHSNRFGFDFFYQNMNDILQNNCMYKSKYGVRRPISTYLKRKMFAHSDIDFSAIKNKMVSMRVSPDCLSADKKSYSLKQINDFRHNQALIREENLVLQLRANGHGVDTSYLNTVDWESMSQIPKIVDEAIEASYTDIIPF